MLVIFALISSTSLILFIFFSLCVRRTRKIPSIFFYFQCINKVSSMYRLQLDWKEKCSACITPANVYRISNVLNKRIESRCLENSKKKKIIKVERKHKVSPHLIQVRSSQLNNSTTEKNYSSIILYNLICAYFSSLPTSRLRKLREKKNNLNH